MTLYLSELPLEIDGATLALFVLSRRYSRREDRSDAARAAWDQLWYRYGKRYVIIVQELVRQGVV